MTQENHIQFDTLRPLKDPLSLTEEVATIAQETFGTDKGTLRFEPFLSLLSAGKEFTQVIAKSGSRRGKPTIPVNVSDLNKATAV